MANEPGGVKIWWHETITVLETVPMKTEYLKTLWMLRFEKIKKTEGEAAWGYQEILDRCLMDFAKEDEIVALLSQLVREERGHEKLAEELIKICHHTHPEFGTLSP